MADETIKTIKRLKYFPGQYLEASDFQAEQDYHVDMRRRGNRALYYGAGILDGGFLVKIAEDDPKKITISSGIGIDADGRGLITITPRTESLPLAKTINQVFLITLEYSESPTDIQTVVEDNVNDATRMEEKLKIKFYEEENNTIDRDRQVIIAQFTLNTDGKVVGERFETSVRQNADARFPHNLTIGQGGNGVLSARHIDGKSWQNDDPDDLFLNWITGKNVHLGFGNNTKSSLFVSGNVGFGTRSPQAGLEIDKGNTNEVALLLNSSGAGWGSGVQFKNTAPQGKTYGIYSSASGKLHVSDQENTIDRLIIDKDGNVGIGIADPKAKLQVSGGAIMPAAGNDDASGILFPENPGGPNAGGDKAWIRYYARSGEKTALEIGVANDALNDPANQDDILLMPSGGVGIGTADVRRTLHVHGSEIHSGGVAAGFSFGNRGSLFVDTPAVGERWVWYSQDGKARLWSGSDKLCITSDGKVGIGTVTPSEKLEIEGGNLVFKAPASSPGGGLGSILFKDSSNNMKALIGFGDENDSSLFISADSGQVVINKLLVRDTVELYMNSLSPMDGFRNTLTPKNIVKAWGVVETGMRGINPPLVILDGFNINENISVNSLGGAIITLTESISGPICVTGSISYIQSDRLPDPFPNFINFRYKSPPLPTTEIEAVGFNFYNNGSFAAYNQIDWRDPDKKNIFCFIVLGKQ